MTKHSLQQCIQLTWLYLILKFDSLRQPPCFSAATSLETILTPAPILGAADASEFVDLTDSPTASMHDEAIILPSSEATSSAAKPSGNALFPEHTTDELKAGLRPTDRQRPKKPNRGNIIRDSTNLLSVKVEGKKKRKEEEAGAAAALCALWSVYQCCRFILHIS